jgi:hypothetical protein
MGSVLFEEATESISRDTASQSYRIVLGFGLGWAKKVITGGKPMVIEFLVIVTHTFNSAVFGIWPQALKRASCKWTFSSVDSRLSKESLKGSFSEFSRVIDDMGTSRTKKKVDLC